MSNSRSYGKNANRDWLLKQQMRAGSQFAQSLMRFETDDPSQESEEKPSSAKQQSPYPGHYFRSEERVRELRLEEFVLWLIDPYDTSYGSGVYSPVRICVAVADFIRSHKEWTKVCYIEQVASYSRSSLAPDGDGIVPVTEPPALWLWRKKDWDTVYTNQIAQRQQTDAQRVLAAAVEQRYLVVINNIRKRYRIATNELLVLMIQEWESMRSYDETAAQWLRFYGWYEIDEKGERIC